jgi:hypothetical protein
MVIEFFPKVALSAFNIAKKSLSTVVCADTSNNGSNCTTMHTAKNEGIKSLNVLPLSVCVLVDTT